MSKLSDYIARKQREYGTKFSDAGLAKQFAPYFESGERIMIDRSLDGEKPLTGTVGVTGGWVPCFLLMRTSRSTGSSVTLSDRDKVIAVKRGRKYVKPAAA